MQVTRGFWYLKLGEKYKLKEIVIRQLGLAHLD